jgi:hypothetical protein
MNIKRTKQTRIMAFFLMLICIIALFALKDKLVSELKDPQYCLSFQGWDGEKIDDCGNETYLKEKYPFIFHTKAATFTNFTIPY